MPLFSGIPFHLLIWHKASLNSRPPHVLKYKWWILLDHLHTLDYVYPSKEKASMLTYSNYVCGHMRDICLGQCQTHLWQVCSCNHILRLLHASRVICLIENMFHWPGWLIVLWIIAARCCNWFMHCACMAVCLYGGKFRGRKFPTWERMKNQGFSPNGFSFALVLTQIKLFAQPFLSHAYVSYGMCEPQP